MATSRVSLVRGPAKITFATTGVCYSKEDFEIKTTKELLPISTSATGHASDRVIDVMEEASFAPDGRWTNAILNAFINPFANMLPGASLLTSTDKPFVASASDGAVHTLAAACVTKLPDLFLSAKKTLFGSLTVRGYRGLAKGWTDANALTTIGTGGALTDTTWNPQNVIVQPYTGVWGTNAGFTAIDTQDGWTISFDLQFQEIEVDSIGKIDLAFKSLSVMAKCIPIGPTSAQVLAAMNTQGLSGTNGMVRGYDLQNDGSGGVASDLVITGADGTTVVTLTAANIKSSGYAFGSTKLRQGEIGFVATRKWSTGAQQPLFTLAAAT